METLSLFVRPECQICLDPFSLRRRPKLLGCGHTCCSACLAQMALGHREICCPWCRRVTHLSGLSVVQLPDDPEALAACAPAGAPVFIRMPDSTRYLLPRGPGGHTEGYGFKTSDEATQTEEDEEEEEREAPTKTSGWTGFCTVLLVVVILILLLAIILHNMSCVSKRFSIISCG